MRTWEGHLREIRLSPSGRGAWIECPAGAVPPPGQYLQCWSPEDQNAVLAISVFPTGYASGGFFAAAPVPDAWEPGSKLLLRGPLGRGFHLPTGCQNLVLIALGRTADRLLPLIPQALGRGLSIAVCSHPLLPVLPPELEIFPESILPEILPWADFLALDIHLDQLNEITQRLSSLKATIDRLQGQVLIYASMPCGGLADCGACAVPTSRGTRLVCKDGPVFDLNRLEIRT